jgi:hypothetical protein
MSDVYVHGFDENDIARQERLQQEYSQEQRENRIQEEARNIQREREYEQKRRQLRVRYDNYFCSFCLERLVQTTGEETPFQKKKYECKKCDKKYQPFGMDRALKLLQNDSDSTLVLVYPETEQEIRNLRYKRDDRIQKVNRLKKFLDTGGNTTDDSFDNLLKLF